MDREEVLKRSRGEHQDEGFAEAENRGRKIGMIAFACVFVFISLFNLFHGRENHAPQSMFWAFVAAEAYPKYVFTKQKVYLVIVIAGAFTSVCALINFVLSVLG